MLARTLAFTAGIFCLLQFASFPPHGLLFLLPVSFIFSLYYSKFRLISLFFLGFSWALVRLDYALGSSLDELIKDKDSIITGVVTSLPEVHKNYVRFQFKINEIKTNEETVYKPAITVRLSWYRTKYIPIPGEVWQFKAKLKRPYGFMNPGGFDYEKWLLRKGVNLTGYVKDNAINRRIDTSVDYSVQRLRHKIAIRLKENLEQPLLGFALALSLGDRTQLTQQQNKVLKNTGTNHLVAISGLHLSLVAGIIFFVSRFIIRRFHFITQKVPAPILASIMSFAAACFYAALAGFALPTQRALIMIGVFLFALIYGRQLITVNIISLAVLLILILDPLALIAADFWLSFTAVAFILYLTRFRMSTQNKLYKWGRIQLLLSIALYPLLTFWFMQIPLYSALANLVAVPLVGFVIVPLLLLALILLFPFPNLSLALYDVIDRVNDIYWSYLDLIARQDHSVLQVAMPNFISLILAIIGMLILLMPKGLPARWLGIFFLLPLFFPLSTKPRANEFDFTLLDVGQGLAAVIQTKEHVLIYDTGARFSERFNTGDAVLAPYLKYKGIKDISILLLSHGDNDHVGGAKALIDNFEVEKIMSSVPLQFSKNTVKFCHAGQKWQWDGVKFEILHPQTTKEFVGNNASCVLKVSSQAGSVLLTGDVEKQAEKSLLIHSSNKLKADILIVPHHGSKTSSTLEFIKQVDPKYAFFPVGYRNRFGFPKQDIMSRYKSLGIETRISYQTGALSARFRKNGLQIDEFRKQNQRIWHARQ